MVQDLFLGSRSNDLETAEHLPLKYANRHGLIAGATGTGKTVTLQGLAEGFAREGVPVFVSDVKGDLSGVAQASNMEDFLVKRAETINMKDYKPEAMPVTFWDLFGEKGLPLRTTISEVGPILLSRILDLNDTQEGVVNIAFRLADAEGMMLLDLKDFRSLLISMGERSAELSLQYGNISTATIGAIQRKLLQIEDQGGNLFFGEPALDLKDFVRHDEKGRGYINVLCADKLIQTPKLYATFLLWMLSELFEEFPEAGDSDKPKLVFFFDEAHLLFNDAPPALLQKIEQVVKLIRSKGIGIYFVTQNPADIPESVLGQLGNRIQHALRAFTAKQRKAIKLAAQNYRENPELDIEDAITALGVGEALVSVLEKKGQPSIVQQTLLRPPYSKLGPVDEEYRTKLNTSGELFEKYGTSIDRESAYEILQKRAQVATQKAEEAQKALDEAEAKEEQEKAANKAAKKSAKKKSSRQSPTEAFFKSMVRKIGTQVGKEIMRGILGALKR